jgi:hypothetical protein
MTDNKREIPKFLENILESDRLLTKRVFDGFDKKYGYEKYKQHLKGLEVKINTFLCDKTMSNK